MKISTLFLMMLILLSACSDNKPKQIEKAFYHWKSGNVYNDNKELNELGVQKLYYRLFEVDYDAVRGNYPMSKNRPSFYEFRGIESIEVIPVVFIKNEILKHNDKQSLNQLADDIVYLVDKYRTGEYGSDAAIEFKELQIDCDWTKSTKENYFYLLKKIKEISGKTISCTLRLYPYAYPKIMGVPPVDKVTLMCYNLIQPLSNQDKNSILDVKELEKYLVGKEKYPLHMDIALPVFYWSQLYKNNQFVELLDKSSAELKDFTKEVEPMWYEVTKDTVVNYSQYFKTGDRIKCEEVSTETLRKALDLIAENVVLDETVTITLFDLKESTFKTYSNEELSSFYNALLK